MLRPVGLIILVSMATLHGSCESKDFQAAEAKIQDYSDQSDVFQQLTYPEFELLAKQGRQGVWHLEKFAQQRLALDIVLVIDNSGSMAEEQKELSTRLQPLLSSVKESDWKINVITTDALDPSCSRAMIRKGDANFEQDFASAIMAGTAGNGVERGILRAVQGIDCPGFLREDSALAVVIVSDEDNCMTTPGVYACQDVPSELNGQILIDKLNSLRKPGLNARVYGLVYGPGDDVSQCKDANNGLATYYTNVITQTGGVRGFICNADYTGTLKSISKDLAVLLENRFEIQKSPGKDSLKVFVNGAPVDNFDFKEGNIVFEEVLTQGDEVLVEYQTDGEGPVFSDILISGKPVESSIAVSINNKQLDPSQYQLEVSDFGAAISFRQFPPDDSTILVKYQEKIPLQKTFELLKAPVEGSVKVWINEIESSEFLLSFDRKQIEFLEEPPAGSTIRVDYKVELEEGDSTTSEGSLES